MPHTFIKVKRVMEPATGILTINLAAIQENWRRVNQELISSATAAAVIKTNAYGLGAAEVGRALFSVGCREFFVANLDEAIAARQALSSSAIIYVLGGSRPGTEHLFFQYQLIPVLFELSAVERWRQACIQQNIEGPCAIKINTGMTRMGLDPREFQLLLNTRDGFAQLQVVLVMSHLACADEPDHPLNERQLAIFSQLVVAAKTILPRARFSLANSSAIFRGADFHFDLVRPGASLYGINPTPAAPSPVLPVVNLRLPILQSRMLDQAAIVGYGATVNVAPPTRLLVAAGGYADGLHRTIGVQGCGELAGQLLPVIGRISMDTTIFDASSLAGVSLTEDAMIEVINERLTVDALATATQALGYEVLTSLGTRYQRQYLPAVTPAATSGGE
jgi:alanine racemase